MSSSAVASSAPVVTPSSSVSPSYGTPVATPSYGQPPAPRQGFDFQAFFAKPTTQIGLVVALVIVVVVIVLIVLFVPTNSNKGNKKCSGDPPTDKTSLAWAQCHDASGTATGVVACDPVSGSYVCYCGEQTHKNSVEGMTKLDATCTTKDANQNTNFSGVPYCGADKKVACGCGYSSASSFTSADNTANGWCVAGGGSPTCKTSTTDVMGVFQCKCNNEIATSNACTAYPGSNWTCNAATSTIDCNCGSGGLRSEFGSTTSGGAPCSGNMCSDPSSSPNAIAINNAFDSSTVMSGPNGVAQSCGCTCTCSNSAWNCSASPST